MTDVYSVVKKEVRYHSHYECDAHTRIRVDTFFEERTCYEWEDTEH